MGRGTMAGRAMGCLFVLGLGLGTAACSGTLVIPDSDIEQCKTSAQCGLESVCVDGVCTFSETPCSRTHPDGYCPRLAYCAGGVCTQDHGHTGWCDCELGQTCVEGTCEDADVVIYCSPSSPLGLCPPDAICVGGYCIPLHEEKNTCSRERPEGLCPTGAACRDGFCIPIDELPCSTDVPDGLCPAGQACDGTECVDVPCSEANPYGRCSIGFVCIEGTCEEEVVLLTCESLDCDALNRVDCDDSGEYPVCTDCKEGYHEYLSQACLPDTCTDVGCAANNRVCDTSAGFAVCGDCLGGYHIDGDTCVLDTCTDLACDAHNRRCDQPASGPATCGDCLRTFVENPVGECVNATCADLGCEEFNRGCDERGPGAQCSGCLDGFVDNGLGECVACLTTATCPAGEYCEPSVGCQQDCIPVAGTEVRCPNGELCTPHGRCVADSPGGAICAAGISAGVRSTPVVAILVDRSGSMGGSFGSTTRWGAVEDVLFQLEAGDSGVVKELENEVKFTMALYSNPDGANAPGCPTIKRPAITEPRLGNHDNLRSLFDDYNPSGETPTGDSIEVVRQSLMALEDPSPKYILLATDGEPDRCEQTRNRGQAEAALFTHRAYRSTNAYTDKIETFILFIGSLSYADHVQDVANAGKGCPIDPYYEDADTCDPTNSACYNKQNDTGIVTCPDGPDGNPINHPYYVATDQQELADSLTTIIGGILSCKVELATLGQPLLDGTVLLDGDEVPSSGWVVAGPESILLTGPFCDKLTDGGSHFVSVRIDRCDTGG